MPFPFWLILTAETGLLATDRYSGMTLIRILGFQQKQPDAWVCDAFVFSPLKDATLLGQIAATLALPIPEFCSAADPA